MSKHVVQLRLKGVCKESMLLYSTFLRTIFTKLNYNFTGVGLPTEYKTLTLQSSIHVNKKAKDNFGVRTYNHVFTVKEDVSTNCLKFVMMNKPAGVSIKLRATM